MEKTIVSEDMTVDIYSRMADSDVEKQISFRNKCLISGAGLYRHNAYTHVNMYADVRVRTRTCYLCTCISHK